MSKNVYDIFRAVQNKRTTNYNERSAAFIVDGKLSKTVYHKRRRRKISAGVVFQNKEGPDEVIVYTFNKDKLQKGDYFIYDDVNYLVYEQDRLTDENINHRKQRAVECNVSFKLGEESFLGYFVSTMRRYNKEEFQGRQLLNPEEKPLLILPTNNILTISSEFLIEKKPWRVVEYDYITNKGITYYYLERGIIRNVQEEESAEPMLMPLNSSVELPTLEALTEYTFDTTDGVFSSTPAVEIIKKTSSAITFIIPFGIEEVTIFTSELDNVLYRVVS